MSNPAAIAHNILDLFSPTRAGLTRGSAKVPPADRWIWFSAMFLMALGSVMVLSSSVMLADRKFGSPGFFWTRQLIWWGLATAILVGVSRIDHRKFKTWAPLLLLVGFGLVILARLMPTIKDVHRWIDLGPFRLQPAEVFRLAFVIYAAAFFSGVKERISSFSFGLLPLLVLLSLAWALLLLEPDTDTFVVLFAALLAIFFAAGGKLKQLGILCVVAAIALGSLIAMRPYLKERFLTFIDPGKDPQGAGYQIEQSLIAIGSGGFFGRGFGQSVQKFSYLPEPIGDSIFAVAGEEFGFFGASLLIMLFLAFLLRGLRVASRAPDSFARLLTVGIVILIGASAFINIASMLGLIPLSGLTLPLVSHGGSALAITLASAGVVLNISRYQKI